MAYLHIHQHYLGQVWQGEVAGFGKIIGVKKLLMEKASMSCGKKATLNKSQDGAWFGILLGIHSYTFSVSLIPKPQVRRYRCTCLKPVKKGTSMHHILIHF